MIIKRILPISAAVALVLSPLCFRAVADNAAAPDANTSTNHYTPSPEVIKNQREFAADRFGIFLHWGIYSMFGQGEWYLNNGPQAHEYAKAAKAFFPADFNAREWVKAIKDAGAKYITFTTRHHDGFSMWHTSQSGYNIVDATPFERDVLKELSAACQEEGIKLHLYYSHIDWTRPDYPRGRTGKTTGIDSTTYNWNNYYRFMNDQLRELLTNYGPIRAIWFDGYWDHDQDTVPFNWQLDEQYAYVHSLQPGVLIANNHHENIKPGEDIQIFERDVPGENTVGYSSQDISRLPLETCNTMNGMWGYKLLDQNYKDSRTLIRYLVKTAGMGANLLLNIGPQPNGELPEVALARLKDMGEWMRKYGETIYSTTGSPFGATDWGTATCRDNKIYLHVFDNGVKEINIPCDKKIKSARAFDSSEKVRFKRNKDKKGYTIQFGDVPDVDDYIIVLETV